MRLALILAGMAAGTLLTFGLFLFLERDALKYNDIWES
jgi:hypothetical protein